MTQQNPVFNYLNASRVDCPYGIASHEKIETCFFARIPVYCCGNLLIAARIRVGRVPTGHGVQALLAAFGGELNEIACSVYSPYPPLTSVPRALDQTPQEREAHRPPSQR